MKTSRRSRKLKTRLTIGWLLASPITLSTGIEEILKMVGAGVSKDVIKTYSYDFWWYHYAYPRALVSLYQRLSPYCPQHFYGRYRPSAFRP